LQRGGAFRSVAAGNRHTTNCHDVSSDGAGTKQLPKYAFVFT
jgi:hypothetical protein